nr:EOG090X09NR [Macrothrix elegans]
MSKQTIQDPLIKKKIVHAGRENILEFPPDTKVKFHFQTQLFTRDESGEITLGETIDDSHKFTQPMELLIGKKFKLEVWETVVQTMALNEVAEFYVDKTLCLSYPVIVKTIRDAYSKDKSKHHHDHAATSHCCGAMALANGPKLGYDDLNKLMENPSDLLFRIELLSVELPQSYKKEAWQMNEGEKIEAIPKLREEGNELYKNKKIEEATKVYAQAVGILEQLQLKEKPNDEEWVALADMKIPFLLNYSQCQLLLGNYYDVITQCTQVLERQPENVKALYRRAKAHVNVWNPDEAKADFEKAATLDPSLVKDIQQQISKLEQLKKEKNQADKAWLSQAFGTA